MHSQSVHCTQPPATTTLQGSCALHTRLGTSLDEQIKDTSAAAHGRQEERCPAGGSTLQHGMLSRHSVRSWEEAC